MQHLITSMENPEFNTRKLAIDVVYTLTKIHPKVLVPYRRELHDLISELRFDKIKPVRDASLEALKAFKETPELEITEEELKKEQQLKE